MFTIHHDWKLTFYRVPLHYDILHHTLGNRTFGRNCAKIKINMASPATEVKRTQQAPNVQNGLVFHSKPIPERDFGT